MHQNPTPPPIPPAVGGWSVAERQEAPVVPGLHKKTFVDSQGYCKTTRRPVVETTAQIQTIQQSGGTPIFAGIFLSVTVRNPESGVATMGHGTASELPDMAELRKANRHCGIVRDGKFWSDPISTDPTDSLEAMWKRVLEVVSGKALAEQKSGGGDLHTRLSAMLKKQAESFASLLSDEIKERGQPA